MASKKIVVKLDLHGGRDKQKAMKAVAALAGIDELSVDMAAQKMTVVGMVDPVDVVGKLRKAWAAASIDSVGPAKEPEKKAEDAKPMDGADAKPKDGADAKNDGGEKKPPAPTTTEQLQLIAELMNQYRSSAYYQNPYGMNPHCVVQSIEEDPNSCAIC